MTAEDCGSRNGKTHTINDSRENHWSNACVLNRAITDCHCYLWKKYTVWGRQSSLFFPSKIRCIRHYVDRYKSSKLLHYDNCYEHKNANACLVYFCVLFSIFLCMREVSKIPHMKSHRYLWAHWAIECLVAKRKVHVTTSWLSTQMWISIHSSSLNKI